MRKSDLRRSLQAALRDLTGLAVDLDDLLVALDTYGGVERCDTDGGRVRSSAISDPTSAAALGVDHARQARVELEREVRSLVVTARRLAELSAGWRATRPEGLPPRCEVMAREQVYEPRHRAVVIDGETHVLGRWAHDWWVRHGRLPTRREARAHAEGRQIRRPRATA